MRELLHLGFGGVLGSAAWFIPRRVAAAGPAGFSALLLDLSPVALAAGLLLLATGRPIVSGFVLLCLGAGFALADQTKRRTLREPVVFSEMSELRHVFTHPHLYLPFAGSALVIAGTIAAIAVVALLLFLEHELWEPNPGLVLGMFCLVGAGGWMASRRPVLCALAAAMRRLRPAGEPFADAARLGPFAMILIYGTIARAERSARRARYLASPAFGLVKERSAAEVPVVVVQCESFFDARRLSPLVPENLLSGFDACCKAGATYGRLEVPAWGANTMRAEFAVLTGIPEDDLGYDRFNPYHAFARAPLRSLVWQLRREGYQTVCLHPFDKGFFRRDLVLPALGFETFLGLESLGGSRRPPYFSDPDLAHQVLRALDAAGPRIFVFAITMGNHGPWFEAETHVDPDLSRALDPTRLPQGGELLRYLHGLRRSDQMLQILMDGLAGNGCEGILAFYGDHLPSLPHAFEHFGFAEWGSDYVLWRSDPSPSRRLDLPAHRLPGVIIDTLREKGAIGRADASSRFEHPRLATRP
jgi:Sulfatase